MIKCICFSRVSSSSHQDLDAQRAAIMKAALKEYKSNEIVEVKGKESAIKLSEEERRTLNELKEIVQEVVKDMRVRRDGKRYIIKVWDVISEIPSEFLYIPHVGMKQNEVYEVLNRDGEMLDISDEIEVRFKRK